MTDLPGDAEERITFVGPAAAEAKLAKLAKLGALPGMAVPVAAVRVAMAAAEEQEYPGEDAG